MVIFELSTIVTWLSDFFIYFIFGDPILAGFFGFIMLFIIAINLGLGADSMIVLGIFSSVMFTNFIFQVDLSIIFIIAVSIGLISMAMLKLMRR